MKSKKSTYKTIFYIVSISVLTFIIILLSINLFIYRNKNFLSYSENTNVDYKVNLKKNNYYQVDKLPSGMTPIRAMTTRWWLMYVTTLGWLMPMWRNTSLCRFSLRKTMVVEWGFPSHDRLCAWAAAPYNWYKMRKRA